jgi:hypothetical protein
MDGFCTPNPVDGQQLGGLGYALALWASLLIGCGEPRPTPPRATPPPPPPSARPDVATVARPVATAGPIAAPEPACPAVSVAAPLPTTPGHDDEVKTTPFEMAGSKFVARVEARADWVITGVANVDAVIVDTVDYAGLRTVFADTDVTNCIVAPDGDEGCVASASLRVLHNDGTLLSLTSTVNLANAQRTSYATTLRTFERRGQGWQLMVLGDALRDVNAFDAKHSCAVGADQGFAVEEQALRVYDQNSYGRELCTFPLATIASELSCSLRRLVP